MSLQVASLFRVDGLVAVITGGGSGIGLTMARALALNGAKRVFILGRRQAVLDAAAADVNAEVEALARAAGPILVPVVCDVTDKASLQAAVDAVAADTVAGGCVNLVVANAGILGPAGHAYGPQPLSISALRQRLFDSVAMADITHVFHVNTTAALFTMYAFLELLDAGNQRAVSTAQLQHEPGGAAYGAPEGVPSATNPGASPRVQSQVIFTSSIAGYTRSGKTSPAYTGSKAAVLQLAKQASGVLSPYGIRVNALAPGLFPSELATGLVGNRLPEEEPYDHPGFIPARKFGSDGDMAGTILYLASPAGSFCNGLMLVVDGGRTAVIPASY